MDHIIDPQNLGGILRTAHFFGINDIILTERSSSPLSPIASKASSGAMEIMNLYSTPNLYNFISSSIDQGWIVYGTDIHANKDKIINLENLNQGQEKFGLLFSPTILVIGNEGSGLRSQVSKLCHQHLIIPGYEKNDLLHPVDSLNVNVATGILLYSLLHV